MNVGRSFGEWADAYARSRVGYPAPVWTLLVDRCGLVPGTPTFEVGPGTGLATRPIVGDLGAGTSPLSLDIEARVAELEHMGGFVAPDVEVTEWSATWDPCGIRDLYSTFGRVMALDHAERERLLDAIAESAEVDFGGAVERRMTTVVYTARRP